MVAPDPREAVPGAPPTVAELLLADHQAAELHLVLP